MQASVILKITPEQHETLQRALGVAFWSAHGSMLHCFLNGLQSAGEAAREHMADVDDLRSLVANTPVTIGTGASRTRNGRKRLQAVM